MYLISCNALAKCAYMKRYKFGKTFHIRSDLIRTRKKEHEEFTFIGSNFAHYWQGTYTIGTKKFGVGDFRLETTIIIKMESQRQSFYPIHFDSFLWAKKIRNQ